MAERASADGAGLERDSCGIRRSNAATTSPSTAVTSWISTGLAMGANLDAPGLVPTPRPGPARPDRRADRVAAVPSSHGRRRPRDEARASPLDLAPRPSTPHRAGGLRGLERRRRRGQLGRALPGRGLPDQALRHHRPRGVLRLLSTRPRVQLDDELRRQVVWPETVLSACTVPGTGRSLITVVGSEPQLRWRTFTEQVVGVAQLFDARLRGDLRSPAGRGAPHPSGDRVRHRRRRGAGHRDGLAALALRGSDRHHRRAPGHVVATPGFARPPCGRPCPPTCPRRPHPRRPWR